jgi:hypothetical protein
MITEEMTPIPAGSNPFHYDLFHMGQYIGDDLCIMFANHSVNDYVIVIHKPTGKRTKLIFDKEKADKASNFASMMDMALRLKRNEEG